MPHKTDVSVGSGLITDLIKHSLSSYISPAVLASFAQISHPRHGGLTRRGGGGRGGGSGGG